MKQNLKDDILTKISSVLFPLIAVLALGISVAAYVEVQHRITAGEKDLAMVDQLNEAVHLHALLGQISRGHVDEVKLQLKVEMAEDLVAMKPLVASSSPEAAGYARCVLAQIGRQQKAHPDYYLASLKSTGLDKTKVVQSGSQVAASKPVNQ
jgi:hypothetical protein